MSSIVGRLQTNDGTLVARTGSGLRTARMVGPVLAAALLALLAALAVATNPFASAPQIPRSGVRPLPSAATATAMPAALETAASASIGRAERGYWIAPRGGSLTATGGGIRTTFAAEGLQLHTAQGTLALSLGGAASSATPAAAANRVVYDRGAIHEMYENGPYGLEQTFTVARPLDRSASLTLRLALGGSLVPRQADGRILFANGSGKVAMTYSDLRAFDARGRRLPARMSLDGSTVRLQIDTRGARYPLHVDPFLQQGEGFTGTEQSVGPGLAPSFGYSVALSADGNTALVGGREDGPNKEGAAWVFTRSGETWSQQGPKLTGGEEIDEYPSGVAFGNSVALSADGNTAAIGGHEDHQQIGAVWVFTRSEGVWTQQGPKLTGAEEDGHGMFGTGVALSADGNTMLVGGSSDGIDPNPREAGAAWVFTRSEGTWTQQGPKLKGTGEVPSEGFWNGGQFGASVALSADGNTALIGAGGDNSWRGAAFVFTRSGETWTQQGEKLTVGEEEVGEGELGFGVALSADGNTALLGASGSNGEAGAAFVFTRSGETWTQQGEKLSDGESGEGRFGRGVSLSGDGNTAIVGAYKTNGQNGAAWVFKRSGEAWVQPGEKLTAEGELSKGKFGFSTALSADGETAIFGGALDDGSHGTVWVFTDPPGGEPPIAKGISVKSGPATGGTAVTISGARFVGVTAVDFGAAPAASYVVNSPNSITAITPATTPGKVEVSVTNADGKNAPSKKLRFTFKKVKKPRK